MSWQTAMKKEGVDMRVAALVSTDWFPFYVCNQLVSAIFSNKEQHATGLGITGVDITFPCFRSTTPSGH
jgi:hypothetical protein